MSKILIDEATVKLVLEALKELVAQTESGLFAVRHDHVAMQDARQTIIALREALAEQPAQQEPVLQDIEQYRMQMAGICTAAIGYWKESDGIHPDYDTLALRDVAKLYAKYDELYRAQPMSHGVIAGALFDFMAWLTTRDERLVLSGADEAGPAVNAIKDFAKMRGLSLDDARVQDWQDNIKENT